MRSLIAGAFVVLSAALAGAAAAQTCATYPNVLQNGATADANQVMADFNCAALVGAARFTGNVGVGTTNPAYPLVVSSPSNVKLQLGGGGAQNGAFFDAAGGGDQFYLYTYAQGFSIWNNTDARNDLTIDNFGRIGIGTTSPGYPLVVSSPSSVKLQLSGPAAQQGVLFDGAGGGDQFYVYTFAQGFSIWNNSDARNDLTIDNSGNVGVGTITPSMKFYVNGTAGGTSNWTVASDARLKTNIAQISDALGLVQRLRGVRFRWRADAERRVGHGLSLPAGETEIGLVAQEVAAVLPEAVSAPSGPDGIYGLKEASLVAVLVEAVKEQQAEIQELKGEVETLKRQTAAGRTTIAAN